MHRTLVALATLALLATPALAGAAIPVASIAPVGPLECVGGMATAMLDGSRSFDPDGEPVSLMWSAPGIAFDNPMSSMPTATFPLGTTPVTLTATDDDGNAGMAAADVRVADTMAAVTSIMLEGAMGSQGWYRDPVVDVHLAAQDACGSAATFVAVDGGAFRQADVDSLVGDGLHTVEAYSVDASGNVERLRFASARIDATAPVVGLVDPRPDQVYVGQGPVRANAELTPVGLPTPVVVGGLTMRADATDPTSGIAKVEFLIDGAVAATLMAAPWTSDWDGAAAGAGVHTLSARATDVAGNTAEASQTVYLVPLSGAAVGVVDAVVGLL